ncbi:MAG: bifunctional oligoribonuclease/PAP phosphatase NrnA [Clostridia bacterium]|nr:bifunctional oligoribonuclease/PAP phosphatase NrnA [Clostridia bacterium]
MKLSDFAEKLKNIRSALIFSHVRPDGDTVGGATALKAGLTSLGIRAEMICASPIPAKFSDFPHASEYLPCPPEEKFEAHIAVDCSTEQMFGNLSPLFFSVKNTFNLDHHVSNTKYAKHNCVIDNASACENVFALLKLLGVEIFPALAESLLLGVVTDTGGFSHKNVTPETLNTAAELVKAGADISSISYRTIKVQPVERARLFAIATSSLKLCCDGKLAMIFIREEDFKKTGATQDLTEGFIDFPLSVKGVEVAVSVMEAGEHKFKISFRSTGRVNVNEIAGTFGGGGHVLASGCMLFGFFEDVVDKLIFTVGNYL